MAEMCVILVVIIAQGRLIIHVKVLVVVIHPCLHRFQVLYLLSRKG